MGLLFGTRAHVEPESEARASYPAITQEQLAAMTGDLGTFATINANGEVARQSVAVDTAIDLLCSLASEMPLHVYRGSGSDRVQLSTPSNLMDPGDTGQGLEDWVYMLINSWLYRGNAYGQETAWDSRGRARQIDLYYPDDVTVVIVDGAPNWSVNGNPVDSPAMFFHRRVNPVPGKLLGASVIEKHARVIGTSISAARYGEQWFKEGAHPSGMLVNESDLTRDQIKDAKALWMEQFRGSREPAAMGRGWQWKQLQVSADESQFLETMRYTEAQCARMFGPAVAETMGYETGGSMTYANVVDRRSDLLTFTLGKWLRRTERILTGLLPDPQYARFDRDSLLASDTLKRYEAHAMALTNRFRTVNEVRDDEDMVPVPWGDEPNEKSAAPVATSGAARSTGGSDVVFRRKDGDEVSQREMVDLIRSLRADPQAPVVNVSVEPTPVNVESPTVNVSVEPTPVTVNVEQATVELTMEPTPVNMSPVINVEPTPITVEPAPVVIEVPARRTETTVERDQRGLITKTTATERDI